MISRWVRTNIMLLCIHLIWLRLLMHASQLRYSPKLVCHHRDQILSWIWTCSAITRVEPIIYRSIILDKDNKAQAFVTSLDHPKTTKSKAFYVCVKEIHLCASYISPKDFHLIFAFCREITTLNVKGDIISPVDDLDTVAPLINSIRDLHPRDLALNPGAIFIQHSLIDLSMPLFQNVTHFDVMDHANIWVEYMEFHLLPQLTHLRLQLVPSPDWDLSMQKTRSILQDC